MQNFGQCPIFSDVADWFAYPALTAVNATDVNTITITAAGASNKGYITLQPQHYFAHCGWAAVTNYDNIAPSIRTTNVATTALLRPPYPNNFTVEIQRGSSNNYSNKPLTQAELCSSGNLSGKQMPFPVIYAPAVTLSFQFTDLTGLFLLDSDAVTIPLQIQLWMVGYSIPQGPDNENWLRFLHYFPALEAAYR